MNSIYLKQKQVLNKCSRFFFLITVIIGLSGCLSTKQYIDPKLTRVMYSDIKPVETKHPVQILFEFQTNNAVNAAVTQKLQPKVVAVLNKTNTFSKVVTSPETSEYKFFITINNIPITKDAASKGVAIGLTFGLAGDMVTDGFLFKGIYQAPNKEPITKKYEHAIHTTIGNTDGPPNLTPIKPEEIEQRLLEDLILNMLNDLLKEGSL